MKQEKLYDLLPQGSVADPLASTDPKIVEVRNTLLPELICPSNRHSTYEKPGTNENALTNYKALGATFAESLVVCIDPHAPLPYGTDPKIHPDGVLFPGQGVRICDLVDGTSNTFALVETKDYSASAWIAGSDVTLAGMPMVKCVRDDPLEVG